jgi:type IV secretory pathway VirB2 component (pilin)
MGVAIIMLIVLAIQYIAASPEGKAEVKKNATVYIVGAIILFAASGILGIIRRFAIQSIGSNGD